MKIILFERERSEPIDVIAQSRLIADSALLHAGRPLFLPDFSETWKARVYTAYRISRLGKTIKPKFAARYYDAVSLAFRLLPEPSVDSSVELFFDNCLTVGPFVPSIENSGTLELEGVSFLHDEPTIHEAISQISRYSTLKNGDLILTEYKPIHTKIEPHTDLHGSIFGNEFSISIR